jgi:hypothetical protein
MVPSLSLDKVTFDDLAAFQLTKLHALPLASIANWRASSQGLAALQDLDPAYRRFGSRNGPKADENSTCRCIGNAKKLQTFLSGALGE